MTRLTKFSVPLCLAIALLILTVPVGAQPVTVVAVVAGAAEYVGIFMDRFSRVVAEERYVQDASANFTTPGAVPVRHRETAADFLLVQTDVVGGWMAFRDVFEVNRAAVRDRSERLTKLFLESPGAAVSQAEAINRESARYNIGPTRTINSPILALAFMQERYRPQFSFSLGKPDRIDGVDVAVLEYQEGARPTVIRGPSGRNLPARGRYWVDAQTGRILKTEIAIDDTTMRSRITVTFRFDDRFDVCVPLQMDEEYVMVRSGASVKATAKYDRFRQFEVKTVEGLK
jgi:hypothetical protein